MLTFDAGYNPYASKRSTVYAKNGVVATSQPLASQAGLDILKKGGNAVDAAIATAACLTVVEPTSNGIGGDAFALVWIKDKLHGLNASGPAPASLSIDALKKRGLSEIPVHGLIPVTVPGAPSAWGELSRRFGRLPFSDLLQPAIDYAENGYPLSPVLAEFWNKGAAAFEQKLEGKVFEEWFRIFMPGGKAPRSGEMWQSPGHARTLRRLAEEGDRSFYEGSIAEEIADFSASHDGFLSKEDLASFRAEWVKPIHVSYKGYEVWEIPPNGQGLVALQALKMIESHSLKERDNEETLHKQIEALKLAFADGLEYITDAAKMKKSTASLLSEEYVKERTSLIGEKAMDPQAGTPPKGGTVYLAAADNEGNMVSFIQSNYMGFGSGVVVPDTGIALQNRGHNFSMDPGHDNALEGGRKTFHTIIPGFLTKGNEAVGPFGVMGGFMQPQGHMQVVMNTIDFNMNPQAALDAPRWQWISGKKISIEHAFPSSTIQQLAARGHQMETAHHSGSFGRGQIIWKDKASGVYAAGTESRTDGSIAAW